MKLDIGDPKVDLGKIQEIINFIARKLALFLRLVSTYIHNEVKLKAIETNFDVLITKVRTTIDIAVMIFILFYWPIALLMLYDLKLSENSNHSLLAEIIFTLPLLPFLTFIRFITFLGTLDLSVLFAVAGGLLFAGAAISVIYWKMRFNYNDLLNKLPSEVPEIVVKNVGLFSKNIALFSLLVGSLLIVSHFKSGPAAKPTQTPIWTIDPASVFIWIFNKIPGFFPLYNGSFAIGLIKDILFTCFTIIWIYAALLIIKLTAKDIWDRLCVHFAEKCK